MRRTEFLLIFAFTLFAETITIQPTKATKREGQNVMDIYYDLKEGVFYDNVFLYFSTDMKNYRKAKGQSGDIGMLEPGKNRHIVWNMEVDFPTEWQGELDVVVKADVLEVIGINKEGYYEVKNQKDGSILIYIPPGEFTMGSNSGDSNEKPVHKVYLDGYFIGKYEVTVTQFRKFVITTGYKTQAEVGGGAWILIDNSWKKRAYANWRNPYFDQTDDNPVVCVSWNDAVAYCRWAGLRLPTEAEWEKAARGTDGRKYPWGNHKPDAGGTYRINYFPGADGYKFTSPVGSFLPGASPYGCLDLAGNVWEWCSDRYREDYYSASPKRNPKGPPSGSSRVFRGGSWNSNGNAENVSSAHRSGNASGYRFYHLGFRVAR